VPVGEVSLAAGRLGGTAPGTADKALSDLAREAAALTNNIKALNNLAAALSQVARAAGFNMGALGSGAAPTYTGQLVRMRPWLPNTTVPAGRFPAMQTPTMTTTVARQHRDPAADAPPTQTQMRRTDSQPPAPPQGTNSLRKAAGAGAGMFAAGFIYGNKILPGAQQMDAWANYATIVSGTFTGSGGYWKANQSALAQAFGSHNRNMDAVATSDSDSASAQFTLFRALGISPLTLGRSNPGAPLTSVANPAYTQMIGAMRVLALTNPGATEQQAAQATASIYTPRSAMALAAFGYQPSVGAGGALATPSQVARSIMAKTFYGKTSVDSATFNEFIRNGGKLDTNLRAVASQAGWDPATAGMMEDYLANYNALANSSKMNGSQIDDLLARAANGDTKAIKQLSATGVGRSLIQDQKNLDATRRSRTADVMHDFSPAIEDATNAVNTFSRALTSLINNVPGLRDAVGVGSAWSQTVGSALKGFGGVLGGIGAYKLATGGLGAFNLFGSAAGGAARLGGWLFGGGAGAAGADAGGTLSATLGADGAYTVSGLGSAAATGGLLGLVGRAGGGPLGSLLGGGRLAGLGAGIGGAALTYGLVQANNAWTDRWGFTGSGKGFHWQQPLKVLGNTAAWAAGGAAVAGLPGAIVGGAIGLGQGLWDWATDSNDYGRRSTGSTGGGGAAPAPSGGGGGGASSTAQPASGAHASPTSAPGQIQEAISAAMSKVGDPYVWGATGPNAFDCSGLIQWAYAQAGVRLARVSSDQFDEGSPVDPSAIAAGDLLFPKGSYGKNGAPAGKPGHVMMALGGGKLIEAPGTGETVRIRPFDISEIQDVRRILGGGATLGATAKGGNPPAPSMGPTSPYATPYPTPTAKKAVNYGSVDAVAAMAAILAKIPSAPGITASKPSYDTGAWRVPHDQVATVHRDEMILTSRQAQTVRDAIMADQVKVRQPGPAAGGGAQLAFHPGAIQINVTGGSAASTDWNSVGRQIADQIAADARLQKMKAGL
jgi:cell wall-associated NlpC family hydrolase